MTAETTRNETNSDRIRELQERIADLKKRWPAHSTPAGMLEQLDELEEELEKELTSLTS